MKKRGQITIFILMGFVILLVFTILFSMSGTITRYATEARAERIVESFFDATSFRQEITHCLDTSTTEAINIISLQGGYIFNNQPASLLNYPIDTLLYENNSVAFAITNDNTNIQNPPEYPCHSLESTRYEYPCFFNNQKRGFRFGKNNQLLVPTNNIPPLYKTYVPGFSFFYNYDYSYQEQLERLILNMTMTCTNFSFYEESFDYGINYGTPFINFSVGKNDIQSILNYPIFVNVSDTNVMKSYQFYSQKEIRLRKLWEIANNVIMNELNNLNSNFTLKNIPKNISTIKKRQLNDFIFTVQDELFYVRNKPIALQFGIKNRIPALDCIGYCDNNHQYDIVVPVNSTLTIKPYGIDPDNENVIYSYVGWKADYDEIWPYNTSMLGTEIAITENKWYSSSLFQDGGDCNYPTNNNIDARGRCAEIFVTTEDIGPHEVVIYAKDSTFPGYYDYQIVNILVDAVASPDIGRINTYYGIPDNTTSIEDIFYLNATGSKMLLGGNKEFLWFDLDENFNISTNISELRYLGIEPNITDMSQPFNQVGIHQIQLRIAKSESNLTSQPEDFIVDVRQCIPFKTTDRTAPFPYNDLGYDDYFNVDYPFFADHTCCRNDTGYWGTYEPTSKTCYQYVNFACRAIPDSFGPIPKGTIINSSKAAWPATQGLAMLDENSLALPNFDDSIGDTPDHINDVYLRNFEQKCSGDRGNTCSGDQSDNWIHTKSCGVCEYCSWNNPNCGKWQYGIVCNSTKKCVTDYGPTGYVINLGKKDIVAMGVCDGNGNCAATAGNTLNPSLESNSSVEPYGVFHENSNMIVSENCNFNDRADPDENSETCHLEDWTCVESPDAQCGLESDYPKDIDCNNYDFPTGSHSTFDNAIVNEIEDTCQWIDWGVNSNTCNKASSLIYTSSGCGKNSAVNCCEVETMANITSSTFDCDSLDDNDPSDKRLIEAESTIESCRFKQTQGNSCNIVDETCSASNVCKYMSNFSTVPLDEIPDYVCTYKNPAVGFSWELILPTSEQFCSDGFDNDCDGLIDCLDPDCYTKRCERSGLSGVCVNNSGTGFCELNEACNSSSDMLISSCISCGIDSIHSCIDNVDSSLSYEGVCAYTLNNNIECQTGQICENSNTNQIFGDCSFCSYGDICNTNTTGTSDMNGICTTESCCDYSTNPIVKNGTDYYCGCSQDRNNFECDALNVSENPYFEIDGHCQENNCCPIAPECTTNCNNKICDQDSDCNSYVNITTNTCYYGIDGSENGDCTSGCQCSYNSMTSNDVLASFGLSEPCEYGFLYAGYCIKENQCIYNCSCGSGGWTCDNDNCPPAGTNKDETCYSENFIQRDDDCTPFNGCNMNKDTQPTEFDWSQCTEYSYDDSYCFINSTTTCFFNDDACNEKLGWQFNNELCIETGTSNAALCWFGNNTCDETGCKSVFDDSKPNDCSYFSGSCPGPSCTYHYDMLGNRCDSDSGWTCYDSSLDTETNTCTDYDMDTICDFDEGNICDTGDTSDACKTGNIIAINSNTFVAGTDTIITISIRNTGINGNFIIKPTNIPPELSITNSLLGIQENLNINEIKEIEFTITTTSTGPFTIDWEIYYDNTWPIPNKLVDTYNQPITVT